MLLQNRHQLAGVGLYPPHLSLLPVLIVAFLGFFFATIVHAQTPQVGEIEPNAGSSAQVDCERLISELETRLFYEPENQSLLSALELVMTRCQTNQSRIQSAEVAKSNWLLNGQFEISMGYHSNPLFSTSAKELLLTLPGQTYVIATPGNARPAYFAENRLDFTLSKSHYQLEVQLQQKPVFVELESREQKPLRSESLYAVNAWYLEQQSAYMVSFKQSQYQYDLYHQVSLSHRVLSDQNTLHSIELGQRLFEQSSYYDSRYMQYHSTWSGLNLTPAGQWRLEMLGVADFPVYERAGGAHLRGQFGLHWAWQQGNHALNTLLSASYQQDQEGYSSILEHNAKRELSRLGTQLYWRYKVNAQQAFFTVATWNRQWSNIALFEWEGTRLQIGWQVKW